MTAETNDTDAARDRLSRAVLSLEGLSVGDAFGQQYFYFPEYIGPRTLPVPPWEWTDDTAMALGLVEVLADRGAIDQDDLARIFARNHLFEPYRGYGAGARQLLIEIADGGDWRRASRSLFGGSGSFGNGAAMRVAPLGAYFAGDLDTVVAEARLSAEVTHAHPEGVAGAIAVAVAAALVADGDRDGEALLSAVHDLTPESETRRGILRAIQLGLAADPIRAASLLGSGDGISAMDTVPFVVWSAAASLDSYPTALWRTVSGLGDRDTTCAMVGCIVVLATGLAGIPEEWRSSRESLPAGFRAATSSD